MHIKKCILSVILTGSAAVSMAAGTTFNFNNVESLTSKLTQAQCNQLFDPVASAPCGKSNPCGIFIVKASKYNTLTMSISPKQARDSNGWSNYGVAEISLDEGKTYQKVNYVARAINGDNVAHGLIVIDKLCKASFTSSS